MFLRFIGSGSALNTALGNNCAYIKKGGSLLLIDCGSTTFSRLQSLNLLADLSNIYVLITHRHPDHVSSLGDLIFYVRYILLANISVLTPDGDNLVELLKLMGVQEDLYTLIRLNGTYELKNTDFQVEVAAIPVEHVEDMDCYGYLITYQDKKVYYSGDARSISDHILRSFEKNDLNYIYQDVCSYDYPNNPHMYFNRLCDLIKVKDRERVFCMHYDEKFNRAHALQTGFKLIENSEG